MILICWQVLLSLLCARATETHDNVMYNHTPPTLMPRVGAERYNVLYFISDDLRPELLSYGQKQMITPNLDKLAATGTTFNFAFVQQAVCGPSRASFMTGRRPAHTMVFENKLSFRDVGHDGHGKKGKDWITCPEHFKQNNWTTLGGGKTFHPNHPLNWDEPKSWSQEGSLPYFAFSYYIPHEKAYGHKGPCPGAGQGDYPGSPNDSWCCVDEPDDEFYDYGLANDTIKRLRFVAKEWKAHGKPFFLQSGFARPHVPLRVPRRMWELYNTSEITLPKHQLPPTNMPGIAWKQFGWYNASNSHIFEPEITKPIDEWAQRQTRHAYYASVSWMDVQVGRVLDELEALGLTESTIVVFHGDHGWQLGEHNSWEKFTNFELACRTPLIIRAPSKPAARGRQVDLLVELIDVYPTIAALANTAPPTDYLDGVSLAPVFDDPTLRSIPTDKGTLNKTLAFSQYPHTTDYDCPFQRNGTCFNSSNSSSNSSGNNIVFSNASVGDVGKDGDMNYMGFRVRDKDWAFCVWLPWNPVTAKASWIEPTRVAENVNVNSSVYLELYDHSSDTGADFDAMDVANLAYDTRQAQRVMNMYHLAYGFFHTAVPPYSPPSPPPSPGPSPGPSPVPGQALAECDAAGGILADDNIACCPKDKCTGCGGGHCGEMAGGKSNCCKHEVEESGRSCQSLPAPCIIGKQRGQRGETRHSGDDDSFLVMGMGAVYKYKLGVEASGPVEKWTGISGELMWGLNYVDKDGRDLVAIVTSESKLLIFDPSVSGAGAVRATVALDANDGLKQPVAATFADHKFYTAMFGGGDVGKNGVVEVDATSLQITKSCPYLTGHLVHNVHAFTIDGKPEIFINDLGNSLWKPFVNGNGVVHLDPGSCTFNPKTIINLPDGGMHVRASAQDVDDPATVYALTQEPEGQQSRLFVLRLQSGMESGIDSETETIGFRVAATVILPARGSNPGEGGADVISIGRNRVLVTDRYGHPGPGMMYLYDLGMGANASNPVQQWKLGTNPRHTAIVGNSAIVSANDKNDRGKSKDVNVTFYEHLLQLRNGTSDYTVQTEGVSFGTAAAPDAAEFILSAPSSSSPTPAPHPAPSPTPAPQPAPSPPPAVKKCPKCKGGECGCSWVKPSSCTGPGDGSCCFKCCCGF